VIVCLAWGALATLMVVQHASAAQNVAATDESLSLDAQQTYHSLADADVTVSTAYLYGRTGPPADPVRYQADIATAAADLKLATAASGSFSLGASLSTLSAALPVYTGYVEDGQIYNSLGYPAGGSFIQVASEEMHRTMLPAARSVYAQENAQFIRTSAQATGLPLAVITLVAGLADLEAAIHTDQTVFASNAAAGSDAFTGLEAGIIVLAVVMAVGCGWGLTRRLAEYR
jgi:hypothetical protein